MQIAYKDAAASGSLWSLGVLSAENALQKIVQIVGEKPAAATPASTKNVANSDETKTNDETAGTAAK